MAFFMLDRKHSTDERANITALRNVPVAEPKPDHEFVHDPCRIFISLVFRRWGAGRECVAWQGGHDDVVEQSVGRVFLPKCLQ